MLASSCPRSLWAGAAQGSSRPRHLARKAKDADMPQISGAGGACYVLMTHMICYIGRAEADCPATAPLSPEAAGREGSGEDAWAFRLPSECAACVAANAPGVMWGTNDCSYCSSSGLCTTAVHASCDGSWTEEGSGLSYAASYSPCSGTVCAEARFTFVTRQGCCEGPSSG